MFINLGKIKNQIKVEKISVEISKLKKKINFFENYIIVNEKENFKIFNRICDHAGGRLVSRDDKVYCPIHLWEFKPTEGKYVNNIKKKEIKYIIKNEKLIFSIKKNTPRIKKELNNKTDLIKIRYINHAFIIFEGPDFKFATDPWAVGPAFANGWWLKEPSDVDWLEELNNCNFIYISHNHPDHLNYSTLKLCKKDIPIVTPNYLNDSTSKLLRDYGFQKIIKFNFNESIKFKKSKLIFSLLKSGDFRDDSGIYFSYGDFTCLADVDCNFVNFGNLPKVDLYCSSYAGGATAYPIMFDNYKLSDKNKKQKMDSVFLLKQKIDNLRVTKSKYFLPYAGSFETRLTRDAYVSKNLYKNKIEDYEKRLRSQNVEVLNTDKFNYYIFKNKKLIKKVKLKIKKIEDFKEKKFLKDFKNENIIDKKVIEEYFNNSKFYDRLILKIELVDDKFKNCYLSFFVDFRDKIKISYSKYYANNLIYGENNKFLNLKIRAESFMHVIYNKLPWEDLLIGFQCKVFRTPNIYNIKFWNYFTNVYISNRQLRTSKNCNKCDVLNNYVDNLIFETKSK
jgi:CMP-N-acetylneuraminate monooxygenase